MSPGPRMKKYKSVDEYIAAAPVGVRPKLEELRMAIKEAAPEAKESISYGMAFYSYKGRLAWMGLFTGHIGFFVRPPILEEHAGELKEYEMTKSSLHLPINKKIPATMVKKLVRAAVKMNEKDRSA